MKKRGQFYLVAVIVLIAVFFAFINIQNFAQKNRVSPVFDIEKEIQIERDYFLDYLASQNLTSDEEQNYIVNFSRSYVRKIGVNKDIIFISLNENNVKLIGNYLNDTEIYYGSDNFNYNFTDAGEFEQTFPPADNVYIEIYNNQYNFARNAGQNIYYLIKHKYDNEVYIIYG